MAKKSGIRSYYSGASAGLIQGAGRAQGPIPVDVQSMFQGMSQAAAANRARKEYTRRQTEAKAATYLGAMESMDMGVVPETYRGGVEQVLTNFKNQYFETAMALKDTKPDHPDYLNLKDKLSTINNSIKKVAGTFSDMAKNRKEDLEFISNRDYSAGNNAEKVDFINNVLTGSADMFIDEFGNVKFDNNGNWTSYDNLPNVAAYDAKSFNSILTTLDGATRLNRQLTDSDRTLYKSKLMSIIKSGGRDTAISLGSDDFLVDGGMGLGGEAEYDANPEAYKQKLIDSYMGLFENAANDSYARYQQKLAARANKGTGSGSGRGGNSRIPSAWGRLFDTLATNPNGSIIDATLAIPGVDVDPRKYKVNWDKNGITFMDPVTKEKIDIRMDDLYTGMWGLNLPDYFKPTGTTNTSATPVIGLPGNEMKQGPTAESGSYDTL